MSKQGSTEWLEARSGSATSSCFIDIIAVSKSTGKPLKARDDYMWKLVTERLYRSPIEAFTSGPTEWGKKLEPFARQAYEVETGNVVIASPFIPHPRIEFCGSSPDGLIIPGGGIEIKCPKDRRVHVQTWRYGMHDDHVPQVQGNIWVNDLEWMDFISYDPRAPEDFRLYVQRITRNDKYILALESHVVQFLADVKKLLEQINANQSRNICGEDTAAGETD